MASMCVSSLPKSSRTIHMFWVLIDNSASNLNAPPHFHLYNFPEFDLLLLPHPGLLTVVHTCCACFTYITLTLTTMVACISDSLRYNGPRYSLSNGYFLSHVHCYSSPVATQGFTKLSGIKPYCPSCAATGSSVVELGSPIHANQYLGVRKTISITKYH